LAALEKWFIFIGERNLTTSLLKTIITMSKQIKLTKKELKAITKQQCFVIEFWTDEVILCKYEGENLIFDKFLSYEFIGNQTKESWIAYLNKVKEHIKEQKVKSNITVESDSRKFTL